MVGYGEQKIAQAAQIACIPISPKCTAGIIEEFWQYGSGLVTDMPWNVYTVSEQYWEFLPEMLALADDLPGVDVAQRLMDLNISSLADIDTWQSMLGLSAGLLFIDTMCRQGQDNWEIEIPFRFVISYLLTGVNVTYSTGAKEGLQDVTVQVTHNYALRVPLINKVFYYMYLYTLLRSDLEDRLSSLPDALAELAVDRAFEAMKELSKVSDSLPLYIIPIKADCTLTVESEFHSDNDNCNYCN
jgi:hypothetical protein